MRSEPDGTLPNATANRLSNQIARAFHGTYGATTGLRMIARSAARQMLVAGASADAVGRTLERCVLHHPACPVAAQQDGAAGGSYARTLVELTRECVAEVAREATTSAPAAPTVRARS